MATYTIDAPDVVKLDRANVVGVRYAHDGKAFYGYLDVNAGSIVMYTVPAGYELQIFNSACRSLTTLAVAVGNTVYVRNVANQTVYALGHFDSAVGYESQFHTQHFNPPLLLPAGYDILVHAPNASGYMSCSIWGCLVQV